VELPQQFSLPGANTKLEPKWRRIKHKDYKDIQWSYWDGPFLACNGIVVMKEDPRPSHSQSILGTIGNCEMAWPNVSVFDPDGHLPIVLQRNALATEEYPFQKELLQDVTRDLLAYLLVCAPTRQIDGRVPHGEWYPGVSPSSRRFAPSLHLCSAEDGLYLADEWHIKQAEFHRFIFVGGLGSSQSNPQIPPADKRRSLLIPVPNPDGTQRYRDWNRFALCGVAYEEGFGYLRDFSAECRRMLLLRSEYEIIQKGRVISKYWWSDVREECSNKEWVVVRTGDCDCGETFDLLGFAGSIHSPTPWPILIEWHLAGPQSEPEALTPLAKLWLDLGMKSPVIPYDPAERRKNLPEAFEELADYIAAHEQLATEEKKAKTEKGAPLFEDGEAL
jgi:hypothetical protein